MNLVKKIIGVFGLCIAFLSTASAEQTFKGEVNKIQVVNYAQGAAYVYVEGASFTECKVNTNWCAIDFSLPAANQMYAAVLAAKRAGTKVAVTSNACWSSNYPRCWKVTIEE